MVYEAMAARDAPWGSLTDVLGFAHHMAPHPSSGRVNDAIPSIASVVICSVGNATLKTDETVISSWCRRDQRQPGTGRDGTGQRISVRLQGTLCRRTETARQLTAMDAFRIPHICGRRQ